MSATAKLVCSLPFRNILCATDFSPNSEVALEFARGLALRFGSVLRLVHVLTPEPIEFSIKRHILEFDTQLQNCQKEMARLLVRHHYLQDVRYEVIVRRGPLSQVISGLVRDREIDLIVLGTHGRHGLAKLALGSVAEEVFRHSECPVLTVGPHVVADALVEGYIDSILYATDFSPNSSRGLWYAMALARENRGSELLLLHALSKTGDASPGESQLRAQSFRQRLRQLIPSDIELGSEPEIVTVFETPSDAILNIARRRQVRLIVMGAKQSSLGMTSTRLPWLTAHRVVSEAPCPVLTVRG